MSILEVKTESELNWFKTIANCKVWLDICIRAGNINHLKKISSNYSQGDKLELALFYASRNQDLRFLKTLVKNGDFELANTAVPIVKYATEHGAGRCSEFIQKEYIRQYGLQILPQRVDKVNELSKYINKNELCEITFALKLAIDEKNEDNIRSYQSKLAKILSEKRDFLTTEKQRRDEELKKAEKHSQELQNKKAENPDAFSASLKELIIKKKAAKSYIDDFADILNIEQYAAKLLWYSNLMTDLYNPMIMEAMANFFSSKLEYVMRLCNDEKVKLYKYAKKDNWNEPLHFAKRIIEQNPNIEEGYKKIIYQNLAAFYATLDTGKALKYQAMYNHEEGSQDDFEHKILSMKHYKESNNFAKLQEVEDSIKKDSDKLLVKLIINIRDEKVFRSLINSPGSKEMLQALRDELAQNSEAHAKNSNISQVLLYEAILNNRIDDAIKISKDFISLKKPHASIILSETLMHLCSLGEHKKADKLLKYANKKFPDIGAGDNNYILPYATFKAYINVGKIDKAKESFEDLIKWNKSDSIKHYVEYLLGNTAILLISYLMDHGSYFEAKEYLQYLEGNSRAIFEKALNVIIHGELAPVLLNDIEEEVLADLIKDISKEVHDKIKSPKDDEVEDVPKTDIVQNSTAKPLEQESSQGAAASEMQDTDNLEALESQHKSVKLPQSILNFVYMVDTGQIDLDNITMIDPRLMHAYVTCKASLVQHTNVNEVIENKDVWYYKNKEYKICDGDSKIIQIEGIPNFYAVIDCDDSIKHIAKFENAFDLGRIARKHNQSGFKFFSNIIELKILGANGAGDERLFTQDVVLNKNGKMLAILNNVGNHEDVNRMVGKGNGHLNIIKSDYSSMLDEKPSDTSSPESSAACGEGFFENVSYDVIKDSQQYYNNLLEVHKDSDVPLIAETADFI